MWFKNTHGVRMFATAAACFIGYSHADSPDDVLTSLKKYDNAMLSDFELQATRVWPIPTRRAESESIVEQVFICASEGNWAFEVLATPETAMPRYEGIDPQAGALKDDSGGEFYIVNRRQHSRYFWSFNLAGTREKSTVWVVWPDSVTLDTVPVRESAVYEKPKHPFQNIELFDVILTSGRGFTSFVDTIVSVVRNENGLLECEAIGTVPGAGRIDCHWKLFVDPSAGFLVRSATATRMSGSKLGHFENIGLCSGLEPGTFVPQSGKCSLGYVGDDPKTHWQGEPVLKITFTDFARGSNKVIDRTLSDCKESLRKSSFPEGTIVYDLRSDPVKTYKVLSHRSSPSRGAR